VLQIQKAGGCGDLEGRGLLQEGHEAMPDVQNHTLASSESSNAGQEEGTDRKATILPNTLKQMKRLLNIYPCLTGKQSEKVPALSCVCLRWIQRLCMDKLKMHSMKMASKPLLNQRMKNQRLEFARAYGG
jgi:hypothetical protein